MCLICVELQKARMTAREARAALREMREGLDPRHLAEVEATVERVERAEQAQAADSDQS